MYALIVWRWPQFLWGELEYALLSAARARTTLFALYLFLFSVSVSGTLTIISPCFDIVQCLHTSHHSCLMLYSCDSVLFITQLAASRNFGACFTFTRCSISNDRRKTKLKREKHTTQKVCNETTNKRYKHTHPKCVYSIRTRTIALSHVKYAKLSNLFVFSALFFLVVIFHSAVGT